MTARLLIACDGTPADRPGMALETCRGFVPTRAATVDAARTEAITAGWLTRWDPGTWPAPSRQQDLCPSCRRAANRCAHTSSMRVGDRRVCADCGEPR